MDWLASTAKVAVPLITALAALLGAAVNAMHARGRRSRLAADVQILAAMPEGSSKAKLVNLIDAEVDDLVLYETEATRQVGIAVMAACFAVGFTALSLWLLAVGGWWQLFLLITVPLAAVVAYGVFEAGAKVPRDEKGNRRSVLRE
jgi:hypothetical protein